MAPQTSHREHAETLLERSATYAPSSAGARLATLAEAQVHATLALADAQADAAYARLVAETEPTPAPAEEPAPKPRRSRKPAASTEEAGK